MNNEEQLDNMSKLLTKTIMEMPIDGIFKIRISNPVSAEHKAETETLVEHLAKKLDRPDIKVIIETIEDLN